MTRLQLVLACCVLVAMLAPIRASALVDPSYTLHPGDVLTVAVLGDATPTTNLHVLEDGSVSVPLAGVVRVAGMTVPQAEAAIAERLAPFYRTPNVVVQVQETGTITVLVAGAVQRPGSYVIRTGAHVSDAIAAAGGMDPDLRGRYPDGRLVQPALGATRIGTEAIVRGGDASADPVLVDRASIYIPEPERIDVTVLGAVDAPGVVSIADGDRLATAIAKAGASVNAHSNLDRITITRVEPDGTSASHEVDLYRAVAGDRRYNPVLRKGDVVYVPVAKQTHGAIATTLAMIQQAAGF